MNSKSSKRRGRRPSNGRSRRTSAKAPSNNRRPQQHHTWPRQIFMWFVSANKAVLAAIGAGLLAVITAWVIGLPHLLAVTFGGSAPALTAAGDNPVAVNACSLGGDFLIPGVRHEPRTLSTAQLTALVRDAADPMSSSGTYTLQAKRGDTVVITSVHTIVLKRIPAQRATVIVVNSGCEGCCGPSGTAYSLQVDLDASNLTPQASLENFSTQSVTGIRIKGLRAVVTNSSPIIIDLEGDTYKYDVLWKLRIDYTVNGQSQTTWIENGSKPFHTVANLNADRWIYFTLNANQTSWTQTSG